MYQIYLYTFHQLLDVAQFVVAGDLQRIIRLHRLHKAKRDALNMKGHEMWTTIISIII